MNANNVVCSRRSLLVGALAASGSVLAPGVAQAFGRRRRGAQSCAVPSATPCAVPPVPGCGVLLESAEEASPAGTDGAAVIDPPRFYGYAGSYSFGDSGAGGRTLLAFYTNYSIINSEAITKMRTLFLDRGRYLRNQGLTQRVTNSFQAIDCYNRVLCVGTYTPTANNFFTIINIPNTGREGPRGTIAYFTNGTSHADGGWPTVNFTSQGVRYVSLRYSDYPGNSYDINFTWL